MRILVVFTGGTISSTFGGSSINVATGLTYRLLTSYEARNPVPDGVVF